MTRQNWLRQSRSKRSTRRCNRGASRRLFLQQLERRQLLAADFGIQTNVDSNTPVLASAGLTAEAELADDLVAFAKALDSAGVLFYGASWNSSSTTQKELFEDGADYLPFREVTDAEQQLNSLGVSEGITIMPTWEFSDGSRATGIHTLEQISSLSGVAIPQSDKPTFKTIGNQTVAIGSPLHIPIDVYDPNGGEQTVTVTVHGGDPSSDNPLIVTAKVLSGNRSIRVDMDGYEDMVFELFEQRAPTATGRVIQLAEDGFYDEILFHRVVDDFVIQAGDPTGFGSGGSALGDFDDEYHPDLQHNRTGVLSFAKAADDTNNSQFFITEVPTRFLDFNYSVFGQLVEGEKTREAISEQAVNASDRPTNDIAIETIEVFNDLENAVLVLDPELVASTTATITVTDPDGNTHSETIVIDVVADDANSQPFLNDIAVPATVPAGEDFVLQLSSTDIERDAVTYFATTVGASNANASVSVDAQTGLVTVSPAAGFTGTADVLVGVRAETTASGSDQDTQVISLNFGNLIVEDPTAGIKLLPVDLDGNVIDSVVVGERFTIQFIGVDARSSFSRGGVFAAYADLNFDPAVVRPVIGQPITYPTGIAVGGRSGSVTGGLVDELGAIDFHVEPTNLEETLLATIEMEAIAAGQWTITSSPADISGNDVLLFGVDSPVEESKVTYGSATLEVTRPAIDTPSRIVLPSVVARAHLVPGDGQQTAMMFGAAANSTITVHAIGSVSLNPEIHALDRNLNPVGSYVDGVFTMNVSAGQLYALVIDGQSTERLFSVKSSGGIDAIYGANGNNIFQPSDVNADNAITPGDALLVINQINAEKPEGEVGAYLTSNRFYDVNGDGNVTPLDALRVLNDIQRAAATESRAESEAQVRLGTQSDFVGESIPTSTIESVEAETAELIGDGVKVVATSTQPQNVLTKPYESVDQVVRDESQWSPLVDLDEGLLFPTIG